MKYLESKQVCLSAPAAYAAAQHGENVVGLTGAAAVLHHVQQPRYVGSLDGGKFSLGPGRENMLLEEAPDLRCRDQALGLDVALEPVFGDLSKALGHWRQWLDSWLAGL